MILKIYKGSARQGPGCHNVEDTKVEYNSGRCLLKKEIDLRYAEMKSEVGSLKVEAYSSAAIV
jgi:hypothetical protein